MKRSGFKARATPMARTPFKRSGQRKSTNTSGKVASTIKEKEWMAAVAAHGCIVCCLQGRGYVPTDVHHLIAANRRLGHFYTIGLCPGHHRHAPLGSGEVARHENKARFEAKYATEWELLRITRERLHALGTVLPAICFPANLHQAQVDPDDGGECKKACEPEGQQA